MDNVVNYSNKSDQSGGYDSYILLENAHRWEYRRPVLRHPQNKKNSNQKKDVLHTDLLYIEKFSANQLNAVPSWAQKNVFFKKNLH